MTLLKFIELQRKRSFLNRVPVEIKLIIVIYSLVSIFIPLPAKLTIYALASILTGLTALFLIAYRDLGYVIEIYLSYLLLFILAYFSVFLGRIRLEYLVLRMIYIYTTAFSFVFMVTTTKIKDFEAFLAKIHVPSSLINALTLTWNFIPSTYSELKIVQMSQKARGVELGKGVLTRIKNSIIVLVPFLYLLLTRLRLIEFALKSRGVE